MDDKNIQAPSISETENNPNETDPTPPSDSSPPADSTPRYPHRTRHPPDRYDSSLFYWGRNVVYYNNISVTQIIVYCNF